MRTTLLIIDPQVDFCDPAGALAVAGADADMARLAAFVRRLGPALDEIVVTLDSHHLVHIAHPIFWEDASGRPPAPFTAIEAAAVRAGKWRAARAEHQERAAAYVEALERNGRYPLVIWPPHCLIGGEGHAVYPPLFGALREWEEGFRVVEYVPKGSNLFTEHYSALQADVPDPDDPATQPNRRLAERLLLADCLVVAGEAGSHCVANTVRDLVRLAGDPAAAGKLVLLEDAVSPVPGFAGLQQAFFTDLGAQGMRRALTTRFPG